MAEVLREDATIEQPVSQNFLSSVEVRSQSKKGPLLTAILRFGVFAGPLGIPLTTGVTVMSEWLAGVHSSDPLFNLGGLAKVATVGLVGVAWGAMVDSFSQESFFNRPEDTMINTSKGVQVIHNNQ